MNDSKFRITEKDNIFTPQIRVKCYSCFEWRHFTMNSPHYNGDNKVLRFTNLDKAKSFISLVKTTTFLNKKIVKPNLPKTVYEE